MLAGKNKYLTWKKKFEMEFNRPVVDAYLSRMWQSIPQEQKDLVREMKPEKFDKVNKRFGG